MKSLPCLIPSHRHTVAARVKRFDREAIRRRILIAIRLSAAAVQA